MGHMNRALRRNAIAHIDLTPGADGFVSVHIMGHGIGHFTPKIRFGPRLTGHLAQFHYPRMRYTPQAQQRLFGKLLDPTPST